MEKAILIIDLPQMCSECPMFTWASRDNYKDGFCTHSHRLVKMDMRPLNCPLKPMPKEFGIDVEDDYAHGWNDCLKEITE